MTSGIVVPTFSAPAQSWQLVDWLDASYTATAGADGVAVAQGPQLPDNVRWLIGHAVITSTSGSLTGLRLYLDQPGQNTLRSGSDRGNYDEAEYPRGLMIPPTRSLIAVWTGATTGAVCAINVQAEILRLV